MWSGVSPMRRRRVPLSTLRYSATRAWIHHPGCWSSQLGPEMVDPSAAWIARRDAPGIARNCLVQLP